MAKTVWVLGAGFSRPLGAPLLDDLFSEGLATVVSYSFPKETFPHLHSTLARHTFSLYRNRLGKLWTDAEMFLDRLDLGARDPTSTWGEYLQRLAAGVVDVGPRGLKQLSCMARRQVAAQCSAFLLDVGKEKTEQWEPYRRWASGLPLDHTVITFNYDRTLEILSPRLEVVRPHDTSPVDGLSVLKLHGSVDWARSVNDGAEYVEVHRDPATLLDREDDCLAIGSPGPTKREFSTGLFRNLWNHAGRVLSPTLPHRPLVTPRPQPDVIDSRSAPSGGQGWKVAETEKPRTPWAAGAWGYSSGT